MSTSRRLCIWLGALASNSEPYEVFTIVEAIEANSIAMFKYCRDIKLDDGTACEFFGPKHYRAEAGHLIKSERSEASNPELSEPQREKAKKLADQVFQAFDQWSDALFLFGKAHADTPAGAYTQIVTRSEQSPREAMDYGSEATPSP